MLEEAKHNPGFPGRVVVYEDQIINGVLTKIQFPVGLLVPRTYSMVIF